MLPYLGAHVVLLETASGCYRVPSADVKVVEYPFAPTGRRYPQGLIANAPWGAPHEIGVARFVDQLEHVGAFVSDKAYSKQFVFHDEGLEATICPSVGYSASMSAFVLVVHLSRLRGLMNGIHRRRAL